MGERVRDVRRGTVSTAPVASRSECDGLTLDRTCVRTMLGLDVQKSEKETKCAQKEVSDRRASKKRARGESRDDVNANDARE